MSEVYFSTARTIRWDYRHSVAGKIESLLDQLNFSGRFTKDDWVAVKTTGVLRERSGSCIPASSARSSMQ